MVALCIRFWKTKTPCCLLEMPLTLSAAFSTVFWMLSFLMSFFIFNKYYARRDVLFRSVYICVWGVCHFPFLLWLKVDHGLFIPQLFSHILHLSQWRTWRGTTAAQNDPIWCLITFSMFWRRRTRPTSPHRRSGLYVQYVHVFCEALKNWRCLKSLSVPYSPCLREPETIILIMKRIKRDCPLCLSHTLRFIMQEHYQKLIFTIRWNDTSAFFRRFI